MAALVDDQTALPAEIGELDDATEFCEAYWRHLTKAAPLLKPWPAEGDFLEALEPECPRQGVCYLRLDLLSERCLVQLVRREDGTLRARVFLAREIDVPRRPTTIMDDARRVAKFHLGFRAEQWVSSLHCHWQAPREFFGRLKGLKILAEKLRDQHLVQCARQKTRSYDTEVHAAWVRAACEGDLAVQPENVLDCGAYRQRLAEIGYPPHAVVLGRAASGRGEATELVHFPIDDAVAIVDVFLDLFHEYPGPAFWLNMIATRGEGRASYSYAIAPNREAR